MASPLERTLATIHPFAFDPLFRVAAFPFGIRPGTCQVELVGSHINAVFGPWTVSTPLANIERAEVTGPYGWPKVIGPPHLSLPDRGLTFATNATGGVCLTFREPVAGIEPFGWIRHRGLTVTVDDPERLVAEIRDATTHVEAIERDEHAVLEARTAAELRDIARELGISKVASMKKAELIERILSDQEAARSALDRELVTSTEP